MMSPRSTSSCALLKPVSILALMLCAILPASAQTITSDPADGATGVSPSAPVTFTFSSAVDPSSVTATFLSMTGSFYPVTSSWSAGNTVLTCTPTPPFPGNATITWFVVIPPATFSQGSFTTGTGTGGGGGGTGTNAITTFVAGKLYFNEQTNSSAPTPFPDGPYAFTANTGLASNETATAVTVLVPGASVATSLSQNFLHHEDYFFFASDTNKTTFEATYPQGNYVFNVTGSPSNLQATVSLPTTMVQPNAPHISNFSAAQTVNATQAFTVNWDAFQGGTASDYIVLSVDDSSGVLFHTPYPGTNGVLTGTATSATIPAGTLTANSNYTAELVFYRFTAVSNSTYATLGYRATGTEFTINAVGAAATTPVVSNPVWSGSNFGFDVATSVNQTIKVRFSTDISLPLSQWQTILTTNAVGTSVHITIPPQVGANGFLRVQSGP